MSAAGQPRLEDLSPGQRALYDLLLREERAARRESVLPAVVPDPEHRHEPFPLTELQEAYWVGRAAGLELGNVGNHGYAEYDCPDLDLARFGEAWQRAVRRHEMLRAVVLDDGRQRILPQVPPYPIAELDLREETPEAAAARLEAVREAMSHQVRPAGEWPLFEVRVSRLPGGRCRLHFSIDGLLIDSWSCRILFAELGRLVRSPGERLPPLELSFRDYVLAERKLRQSALYRRSEAYWRERLATLPPPPALPLARPPAALSEPRFVRRSGRLEPAAWRQLKERALEAGLTAAEVLLTAYAEILAAWSESPRFTLNLPISDRLPLHPQVNDVLGEFVSFILLAVDHSRPAPFAERARRLRQRLWQDLDHRYSGGVRLLREVARQRGGRPGNVAPVVFSSNLRLGSAVAETPVFPSQLGELVVNITQTPQVWLDHLVGEEGGALVYDWDAVEALFPPGMLDQMFDLYGALLERLAGDPASWERPAAEWLRPAFAPPAGRRRRVLSEALEPCPTWVPGRLFATADAGGGSGAEVSDPATGEDLRPTGELGRRLPGGAIEVLGASAGAVWISGRRVDPRAVEAVLAAHPAVAQGAVTTDPGGGGLTAYVVPGAAEPQGEGGGELPGELRGAERMRFKLSEPGLRPLPAAGTIRLPATPDGGAAELHLERRSYRRFARAPVAFEDLASWLAALRGVELPGAPLPKYRFPSAGGLYPVQAYLWPRRGGVTGLPPGPYYYHPRAHRLLPLGSAELAPDVHLPRNRKLAAAAAFTLLLVADLSAIVPLYGEEAAREFCLLEAGAMSQLLMSAGPALQIGLCPVSRVAFDELRPALGVGPSHLWLHGLVGGRIEAAQASLAGWLQELAAGSDGDGEPRPVATGDLAGELRRYLAQRLLEAMVPAAVVLLPAMPRTPAGGVDRAALRPPARTAAPVAPRTRLEQEIAAVFEQALGVERPGVDDNFFDLGGSSLHLVQVSRELRRRLLVDVSVVDLFQHPTIGSLAASLNGGGGGPAPVDRGQARAAARREARSRRRRPGAARRPQEE